MTDCRDAAAEVIKQRKGRARTRTELADLQIELVDRCQRMKRLDPGISGGEAWLRAAKTMADSHAMDRALQKRAIWFNAVKAKNRRKFYEHEAWKDEPALALEAMLVGVNKAAPGARDSVAARAQGLEHAGLGKMLARMKKEGLEELARKRDFNDATLVDEMVRVSKGGKAGVRPISRLAAILVEAMEDSRQAFNRAGGWIRPLSGYTFKQTHNRDRMLLAGKMTWMEQTAPLVDVERTLGSRGGDLSKFLSGAYDTLVSLHGDSERLEAMGANISRKAAGHRDIHFKDGVSLMTYYKAFGPKGSPGLFDMVLSQIRRRISETALVERFGTNPRAALAKDRVFLAGKNPDAEEKLGEQRFDWFMDQLDGAASMSVNPRFAEIGAGIRNLQTLSKLGSMLPSQFADQATIAEELKYQGVKLLDRYTTGMRGLMKSFNQDESRAFADLMGAGIDGVLGALYSRYAIDDGVPGVVSNMMRTFFRLNGAQWWDDSVKRGVGVMLAHHVGGEAGKKMAALPDELQRGLRMAGIDERAWEVVRAAPLARDGSGRALLPSENLRELPLEVFALAWRSAGLSRAPKKTDTDALMRIRDQLEGRLSAYYIDRIHYALPSPGARERAIMTMGMNQGSPLGEAIRLVMQFKGFVTSYTSRAIGQEIYGGGSMAALGEMIVGATIMGFLAYETKEMVKGREPRKVDDLRTWSAALAQGGGLGIMGDFFFGVQNRHGSLPVVTMFGPTESSLDELLKTFAKVKAGKDPTNAAFRSVKSHIPFHNLFYTRLALDYFIFWRIQKELMPGWGRRHERRMKRDNDQEMWLAPAQ